MKKSFGVVIVVVIIVISASFTFAAGEETLTGQKVTTEMKEGWSPIGEISITASNKVIDEYSGGILFNEKSLTESGTVGMENIKKVGEDVIKKGFYIWVDNFVPSEDEYRETDIYLDAYAEFYGWKIDVGYGRYWIREFKAIDFNGVYTEITLPAPVWKIVPFVKAEYRFAEKVEMEDGSKISVDGFVYYGGLRREFEIIPKRVNLLAEVSVGGNTGIYGGPVENLSFSREKLEFTITLAKWLKLKGSVMTQQNLGLKDVGIAADTDRLFVSGTIVISPPEK